MIEDRERNRRNSFVCFAMWTLFACPFPPKERERRAAHAATIGFPRVLITAAAAASDRSENESRGERPKEEEGGIDQTASLQTYMLGERWSLIRL